MNYKIKMSKEDFFKVNNKILASNLEIIDDDVIFEVESGSFNILKKTNYEFKIVESMLGRTKRIFNNYGLLIFGFLFLFAVLYMNSYRVSEIVFNRETKINQEIEKSLKESYKTFLFFDFIDLDYYEYSRKLSKVYFEYPYISVEQKNNKIYVYIADINEVNELEKINKGNVISDKTGIIDSYYVYSGINNVYKNKLVNSGDVLIEGIDAKGLIMGTTYKRVNISIPKEETILELTGKTNEYFQVNLLNHDFDIKKETEFELFNAENDEKFNIFDFFIIKKIVEFEKSAIIKTYTLEEGLNKAIKNIEDNFYSNSNNDLEKIISITTLSKTELENTYEFSFIIKSYESFGVYEE